MSFDIYFKTRDKSVNISEHAFKQYFKKRKNYIIVNNKAEYLNQNTDVYFSFLFENAPSGQTQNVDFICFSMNFFRPFIFGLEAEPEVHAFVEHFDLLIDQDVNENYLYDRYDKELFLQSWYSGNDKSYDVFLNRFDPEYIPLTYPAEKLKEIWSWNYQRDIAQDNADKDIFIPKVMFFLHENRLKTGCVWSDGASILLPEVDIILIPRKGYSPETGQLTRVEDLVLAEYTNLLSVISQYPITKEILNARKILQENLDEELKAYIKELTPLEKEIEGITIAEILDEETIKKYRPD
jgi:hypothetical protein